MAETETIRQDSGIAYERGYNRGYRAAISDLCFYLLMGLLCAGLIARFSKGE